ncbi:MAG: hypothetical protein R3B09_26645 [Nannocystaceae bacterium]
MSDDDPKIDREQAERILGRAASLAVRRADEVSLVELEAAAEEAGLDRALVRRAAAELEVELARPPRRFGMETLIARRRLLPRRLDRPELERLLARLDTFFGAHGQRSVGEGAATWYARHVQVSLEPHEGGTLVQISERFVNTAAATGSFATMSSGALGFVLVATIVKALHLGAIGFVLASPVIALAALIGLTVARRRHAATLRHTAGEFERGLDSLERTVAALGPASTAPATPSSALAAAATASTAARRDEADDEGAEGAREGEPRRRRRRGLRSASIAMTPAARVRTRLRRRDAGDQKPRSGTSK